MRIWQKAIAFISAVIVLLSPFATREVFADAPPSLPSSFYGTIKLDGNNVPIGTLVSAFVGSNTEVAAQSSVTMYESDSIYGLNVRGDSSTSGATVTFKMGDLVANETGVWTTGGNVNLNLTFTSPISPNLAPVSNNDSVGIDEDTSVNFSVLTNDTDTEGDALTVIKVTNPTHGALTLNADQTFTYTPSLNYYGEDSFTYKVNDGNSDSNTATVSIIVNPINDAPVALNNSYSTNQDVTLNVGAPGVTGNDSDIDSVSFTVILASGTTNGIVTLNNDGSFSYVPNTGFTGLDSFSYKISDGSLESNTAIVSIAVVDNVAPIITISSYSTSWTNQDITVSASTNEGVLDSTFHTFTENGSFTFIATDSAGNSSNKIVTINNIDKSAPTNPGTPTPDVTSPTTQTNITWTWAQSNDVLSGVKNYIWSLWKGSNESLTGTTTNNYLTLDLSAYGEGDFKLGVKTEDNVGNFSSSILSSVTTINQTTNPDTVKPVITIKGSNPVTVSLKSTYNDTGATATDNVDGDLTSKITVTNNVNTNMVGTYTVVYTVSDSSGNIATTSRTVNVVNNTAPVIFPPYFNFWYFVPRFNYNPWSWWRMPVVHWSPTMFWRF